MTQAALLGIIITVTASLIVLGSLAIFAGLRRPKRRKPDVSFGPAEQDVVFIFRDHDLIDCSDSARALLKSLTPPDSDSTENSNLAILLEYLSARFENVQEKLGMLAQSGGWELTSHARDGVVLSASFHKGLTQLRLTNRSDSGALLAIDRLSHDALQTELTTLRSVLRNLPTLVWQSDAHGYITWANAAYIQALQGLENTERVLAWPLPDLFADCDPMPDNRLAFEKDGQTHWFSHSQTVNGETVTHFATPIDATVQSEAARRESIQTVTRTFASLRIGLALFDADRQLQVFNPALVDLTGLEPLFLSARPSFEQVLYAMREKRMLPEPKNFNSWRNDIVEMEKAAENGEYSEEWCLEGGRTYLVTGRPQPNGAIALFIQDVTTETTLVRSFQAEIELAHKALDRIGQGVIIFGFSGQAMLANAEYVKMWQTDPCADLADKGLPQALGQWSNACEATQFWGRLAEFITTQTDQAKMTGTITLRTGESVVVTGRRLTGGDIMITFQSEGSVAPRDRRELDLHSELFRRPDIGGHMLEEDPKDTTTRPPLVPRKQRTARHAGNRVRA
jgi:PAS domain-containing protein